MSHPPDAPPALARTPAPPYYAVIFTSIRALGDAEADRAYDGTSDEMVRLAKEQPGYLGFDSVRDATGFGTTVSYWASLEAIAAWRANLEHREAQRAGRAGWYAKFTTRVCKVERANEFSFSSG
ncbi:MAG TPA: antibiotic biosynthesis monooxygenase [Polyangiaceae bacterium]|jgi:heme-degrading monooxygenase HmoA